MAAVAFHHCENFDRLVFAPEILRRPARSTGVGGNRDAGSVRPSIGPGVKARAWFFITQQTHAVLDIKHIRVGDVAVKMQAVEAKSLRLHDYYLRAGIVREQAI